MFLALAIQLPNYNQSVNKRVVPEMTWRSQEGAPIVLLFLEADFFKIGGKCGVEIGEIVKRLTHQFVRHSRLLGLCYCFGGR